MRTSAPPHNNAATRRFRKRPQPSPFHHRYHSPPNGLLEFVLSKWCRHCKAIHFLIVLLFVIPIPYIQFYYHNHHHSNSQQEVVASSKALDLKKQQQESNGYDGTSNSNVEVSLPIRHTTIPTTTTTTTTKTLDSATSTALGKQHVPTDVHFRPPPLTSSTTILAPNQEELSNQTINTTLDAINNNNNNNVPKKKKNKKHQLKVPFHAGNERYHKAYELAMKEMKQNIVNMEFIAGAGWTQLWTRDTSYAIELGAGLLFPGISKRSLQKCIENKTEHVLKNHSIIPEEQHDNRNTSLLLQEVYSTSTTTNSKEVVWYQDECGHFGSWPQLSDAIVGVRGAWSLYTITGDKDFLYWAFKVTMNSLQRAEEDVFETEQEAFGTALSNSSSSSSSTFTSNATSTIGRLFKGCSSFMESNSGYPSKYSYRGDLVGKTKALSTNMLHYNGYEMSHRMALELGRTTTTGSSTTNTIPKEDWDTLATSLHTKARALRHAIRSRLWSPNKGYYTYLEDENNQQVNQIEALGHALVLLSNEFEDDPTRIESIFATTLNITRRFGTPCLWPRNNNKRRKRDIALYYHDGRIWPFVQGYWAMAAAKHHRLDVFTKEIQSLIELSEMQNTFAEFYEFDGSFPKERRRQLWSTTGFLSMIYHGLFGMMLEVDGIWFHPIKPVATTTTTTGRNKNEKNSFALSDIISLSNVPYRDMQLDIFVSGYGTVVSSFQLDAIEQDKWFVPCTLTGRHRVDIVLEVE